MVFDDFTKSFTDVTSKVTDTVMSPIKSVKNSVSKTVLGPNLDLIGHAVDSLKIKELQELYKKELTRWVTFMKKGHVSAVKLTAVKKALVSYNIEGETFPQASKNLEGFIVAVKKQFHAGYQVVAQKDGNPELIKSKKWTQAEKKAVTNGIEELQSKLETGIKLLNHGLAGYYTTPLVLKIDQEKLMKETKKNLEKNHDKALDTDVDLIKNWRKYINLLRIIEKNMNGIKLLKDRKAKALPTEKKTFDVKIKTLEAKNKSLLKKEGKVIMATIAKIEKEITETYKHENDIINTFSASYSELQSSLFQWQSVNKKKTETAAKTGASSRKTLEKSASLGKKHDELSYKKIENTVKKPYIDTQGFIKTRNDQTTTHNKYMEVHAKHVLTTVYQLTQLKKDIFVKEKILNEHHTFTYNDSILLRIKVLFVGFANRYHKRHVSLAKEAWNKLVDLKRSNSTLFTQDMKAMQKKAEIYNGWIKQNNVRSRNDKATIDSFKKSLWNIVRLQKVLDYEKSWINATKEALTLPGYAIILNGIYKTTLDHKKRIGDETKQIQGAIQKTDTTIKDKEKSLNIKSTRILKKEVESLHKQRDDQELYLDLFEHYVEDVTLDIQQTQDLKKGYTKAGKKAQSTMKNYEKLVKNLMKKLGNTAILKDVKWTSVFSDKAVKI